MAVVLAPLSERLGIGKSILARTEQPRLLPIPGHAFAAEIIEVGRRAGALRPPWRNDAGLDDSAPRKGGQQPVGLHSRPPAAAEAGAIAGPDPSIAGIPRRRPPAAAASACAMKGLALLRARRTDATWPDTEIVLGAHGRGPAHRAKPRKLLGKRRNAGCIDQAHLAQTRHNPLKNHNRTRPHIAALYPAIVRLWCSLPRSPANPTPEPDIAA